MDKGAMRGRVIQGFFVGGAMPLHAARRASGSGGARTGAPPPAFGGQTGQVQARMAPGRPPLAHQGEAAQRHGGNGNFEIDPAQVGLNRGGGSPLPQAVLAKMEAAFGADFSGVRVHVGPQASRIGAIAFTMGDDLYFAPGQFQPDSVKGQQLIGHELAHVIQQRQGRVRAPGSGVAVVQDHALEAEADRLGMRAAAHRMAASAPLQAKMRPGGHFASGSVHLSHPMREPGGALRVSAGVGGREVGSLRIHPRAGSAEITDLGVDASYREQGLGKQLLANAARTGMALGKAKLSLHAQDSGSGRLTRWYKTMGFVQVGTDARGYARLEAPAGRLLAGAMQPKLAGAPLAFGAVAQPKKRERHSDKGYSDKKDFNPDDSDSETEVEDEKAVVAIKKVKTKRKQHLVVFNHTKKEGYRLRRGKRVTKRDKVTNKRLVPRVDHYVYRGEFPNLSADAKTIHDVIPVLDKNGDKNRSFGATTVVCAVFMNKHGKYVKYCFTNLNRTINSPLATKAKELHYHAVVGLQGHAEAEMIQYSKVYKVALVALGCDKPHCHECSSMLTRYYGIFASDQETSNRIFKNYHWNPILTEATKFGDRPKNELKWDVKGGRVGRGDYDPTPEQMNALAQGQRVQRIPPDGDCLYRAIILSGHAGHSNSIQALRNRLGRAIRTSAINIIGWGDPAAIARQIETMGSYDNEAGDYTPELLTTLLGIRIRIIDEAGESATHGVQGPVVTVLRVTYPLAHFHLVL